MTKAAYVGVAELPAGYTKLEYVESNGNQYIDTGYVQVNDVMELDITFVPLANAGYYSFFGVYSYNNYSMCLYGYGSNTSSWFVGRTDLGLTLNTGVEYTINAKNDPLYNECEFIISGGTYNSDDVMVLAYEGSLNTSDSMYLFAQNNGSGNGAMYNSCCRIKRFAYKDNGVLVRDYVPVLNPSGVPGMFDKVEQKFYPSNTSTALIAGPAVSGGSAVARKIKKGYIGIGGSVMRNLPSGYTQLAYIEGTGSQYINTGLNPNSNTRVVMDSDFIGGQTGADRLFGAWNAENSNMLLFLRNPNLVSRYYFGSSYRDGSINPLGRHVVEANGNKIYIDGTLAITGNTSTFSCNYPLYLLAMNDAGSVLGLPTIAKVYSCHIYGNGTTFDRDYVPAKNSSGEVGLFDMVTKTFYTDAAGVGFVAGPTATPDGIARKIKKAYIGVGGIARPFWSGGELAYYGTATALSRERYDLTATTVGNYALFSCGFAGGMVSSVDAYDTSLTRSQPADMFGTTVFSASAATVGNYALFGGGYNGSYAVSSVTAYDSSLIRSLPTGLSAMKYNLAATSVGNYALFGGGYNNGSRSDVDAYNTSLTRSKATVLSSGGYYIAATTVGNYALFGGGLGKSTIVDAYNASLTHSTPTSLSRERYDLTATTVGNYALFGGGIELIAYGYVDTVDSYDASLTRSTPTTLSSGRSALAATTVGNYALFGGGLGSNAVPSAVVDAYDASLTRTTQTDLTDARSDLAATTVGNYALFGGGDGSSIGAGAYSTVDVYTIA